MMLLKRKFRKYFKKIFLVLCLMIIIFYQLSSKANSNDSNIREISTIQNDLNVNTSDYLFRFKDYTKIKNEQKREYDLKNSDIKAVFRNARTNGLNKSNYTIYEYTKFFDSTKNCQHGKNLNKVYLKQCPFQNCRFSCDKNELKYADSVLFHESDMKKEFKLDPNYIKTITEMHISNPEQIYVLWNDETNKVLESFDSINFNWTLSYRYIFHIFIMKIK
jgi:hypothetical protein